MFRTVTGALKWYYENEITLRNASSIDLSRLKSQPQRQKRRALNFSRLELHATINYHLSKLSEAFQFILRGYYLEDLSSKEIGRALNEKMNTRSYCKRTVEECYSKNKRKLERTLINAGVISDGRGAD